jgi:hypothetical protein
MRRITKDVPWRSALLLETVIGTAVVLSTIALSYSRLRFERLSPGLALFIIVLMPLFALLTAANITGAASIVRHIGNVNEAIRGGYLSLLSIFCFTVVPEIFVLPVIILVHNAAHNARIIHYTPLIFGIWSLILLFIGIRESQNFSMLRTLGAWLLAGVLNLAAYYVVAALIFLFLFSYEAPR